jgi:hypothetical protein
MTVEKIKHNGHLVISDIVNDQYISEVYIGYSLKDAKRAFKNMIKGQK